MEWNPGLYPRVFGNLITALKTNLSLEQRQDQRNK